MPALMMDVGVSDPYVDSLAISTRRCSAGRGAHVCRVAGYAQLGLLAAARA